jgi:hypothetical protein
LEQAEIRLEALREQSPKYRLVYAFSRVVLPEFEQCLPIPAATLVEAEQFRSHGGIAEPRMDTVSKSPIAIHQRIVQVK